MKLKFSDYILGPKKRNEKMTTKQETPPQPLQDQMDAILKKLHDERETNTELRLTIQQMQVVLDAKTAKIQELEAVSEQKQSVRNDLPPQPQPDGFTQPEKSQSVKDPQDQPVVPTEMENQLTALRETLDVTVRELVADRTELSRKLDEKTSRYQELLERVQDDRYRKDKVKILRRNINLRNLISGVLDDYRLAIPRLAGYDAPASIFLEQQLEKVVEKLDADLRQEMLVPLVNGREGSDFDAEHQEIVEQQPTDRPELDGKVCRSVAPGYVWTLPYIFKPRVNESGEEVYTYRFLLRSEDVITYKYINSENNHQ